jgi:hypothetical protein
VNAPLVRREAIGDEELRRLADQRSHRMVWVLVEPRQPTVARALERDHGTMAPGRVHVLVPERSDTGNDELAAAITCITGRTPHYLSAPGVFVARASGAQLAKIDALPSVAAIRPCRHVDARPAPTVEGED